MKKLFLLIAFLFISALSFAQQQVWVNGYTRSNGTYVQGHYRTAPDRTRNNNWSTVGNTNPHTGKQGYLQGDSRTRRGNSSTSTYRKATYTSPTYLAPSYKTYTTPTYSTPTYSTPTYSTPSYSTPSYSGSQTLYTGSRGGTYYINSNGNKSYVR